LLVATNVVADLDFHRTIVAEDRKRRGGVRDRRGVRSHTGSPYAGARPIGLERCAHVPPGGVGRFSRRRAHRLGEPRGRVPAGGLNTLDTLVSAGQWR
jgi:hypothetical protein